ncbi:MAG TPA: aminopeptidase P N-terminal domain-containing protein [Cytophagaceae bacterium]
MRYSPIDNKLFIKNRENFQAKLKPNSIAIFQSNDVLPTNADGTMPFRQNNDLFYLSGIDQEETILILYPDAKQESHKEILFLRETNEHIATWEGEKLTKDQARELSGIKNIYWNNEFESVLNTLISDAEYIYLNSNEHSRAEKTIDTKEDRFNKWCMERYPLHKYERAAPILHQLRSIKSDIEIELIKEACKITEKAFRRILKFVKPGVMEYEIEAEITHEFIKNRSRGHAYMPIIASGKDSCVLHYITNNKQCKDGDLLLLDFGAEYANYASDLTRTIPVNGKFSKRQKEVYLAVLKVMKFATSRLVVGNNLTDYNKEVGEVMQEELIRLGLLKAEDVKNQDSNAPLYKKYFMHGTSHFLGLDVHDVGSRYMPFQEGMVFTCEPGIYIRDEKIGIRLENDILITKNGPVDLMKNIPLELEEIESLMND